jgi:hypothetical protein
MKKLLFLPLIALMISCGEKSSDSASSSNLELTYEIDTVMVDAGDHLVYLQQGLRAAGLTPSKDQLYNFNTNSFEIEVFDLNEMKMVDLIPLEKEGPTGIGNDTYIPNLQIDHQLNTYIYHFDEIVKISQDLKKVDFFRFEAATLSGDKLKADFTINQSGLLSEDGAYYFSFYGPQDFVKAREGISIVKLDDMSLKMVAIPELEDIAKFSISYEMENGAGTMATQEYLFLVQRGTHIYFSSSSYNFVYQIEISTGKAKKLEFHSNITRDSKTLTFETKANSKEEFNELHKQKMKQVSFGNILFDDSRNLFWRFSSDPDQLGKDKVLTLFNLELQQVMETSIREFDFEGFSFIKEGIFHRFINIDDEMAFVRIKPTITYE